eukprot:1542049-Rhodomonas_salina.1
MTNTDIGLWTKSANRAPVLSQPLSAKGRCCPARLNTQIACGSARSHNQGILFPLTATTGRYW